MAAGRIEVELVAKDLISPVLSKLKSGMKDSFLGNLGADLAIKGIDTVLAGVGKLQAALGNAMSIQTQSIGNANNLAGVTGLSFGKATGIIDGLNLKLAEVAAALPGTAQDFVAAANMIAPAFAEGFGKLTDKNIPDFQNQLTDLTKNMVLLGQTAQVSSADVAEFSRGFISGTRSFEELRDLNFGTKNPAFMKAVQDEMKRQGIETKTFQKLTAEQRKALLLAISQKLVNPEAVAALTNSAEGLLASAKDGLFDPTRGVFGVLRKVMSEGNRSAMDAFTDLLKTSLRLGGTITELAKKAGLTIDPMKVVIEAIDGLNDFLVGIQKNLDFKAGMGKLQDVDFASILSSITTGMTNLVSNIFTRVDYAMIGRFIGNFVGRGLVALLKILLDPQAWFNFIRTLKDGVAAIGQLVLGLIAGLVEGLVSPFRSLVDGVSSTVQQILGFFQSIPSAIGNLNPFKSENQDGSKTAVGQAQDFLGGVAQQIPFAAPVSLAQPSIAGQTTASSGISPSINVSVAAETNADPQAIAQTVMQAISDGYNTFRQTSLA